jgi:RNA polymerase sigma-32 factor
MEMKDNYLVKLDNTQSTGTELVTFQASDVSNVSYENSLQKYLMEINRIPSLSQEEEFMLAKAFLEQSDRAAANKLVTSHLKLVAKIAMSYKNYGLPINEMISEGNVGLIYAVKKYNPDLGFRLSTYAMWWIKANIQDYILKSWSLVKMGTTATQKKLFFSLSKMKKKISALYSRTPNDQDYEEIAKELGVSKKEVLEANERLYLRDMSLNQLVQSDNQNAELIDFLPETRPNQEVIMFQEQESSMKKHILSQGLNSLNDRELYIIKHRKLKEPAATLEELSNKFHISKERVRQIENRAFEKLQQFVLSKFDQPLMHDNSHTL